ncbi:MAG: hypothetical protein DWQ36_12080 [Acidobacteria bacterium]|nr:MAG: hypothetical protein DWQ30_13555 [Acidobacteriota bacterium]REK07283.1 MAG: hypothetical protein DWQ36_12080 [Acidobacteriota bacterium]
MRRALDPFRLLHARLTGAVLLVIACALVAATPAAASDFGFYASLKAGTTDVDASLGDNLDQILDGDDETTAIEAGFRFGRFWGVQAGYHDFGEVAGSGACPACGLSTGLTIPTVAETTGYSLSFVPELPLGNWLSVFAKGGLIAWQTDIRAADSAGGGAITEVSEEDLIYGLGVRVDFLGPFELFGEWESIAGDFETISFGVTLLF